MNTFYNGAHRFYCGVDLHKKTMYLCVLNERGETVFHKNVRSRPDDFLRAVAPFREDLVVAVECMFAWYWLADLCQREEIAFVLGHALYMRAVHGLKTKNDRQDAYQIARLVRGGTFPMAYVYPAEWRPTLGPAAPPRHLRSAPRRAAHAHSEHRPRSTTCRP